MGSTSDDLWAMQEITAVIHRYCRALDRMDAELGYSVWHEDGQADYGNFQGTGRAFIDFANEYHRALVSHSHFVGNVLIELDGDRATSETYVDVILLEEKGGRYLALHGRGRYLDRWSRRDGRWALDHRTHLIDLVTTQETDGVGPAGRRDATDPSYDILRRQLS
jgi:hypothetical protein